MPRPAGPPARQLRLVDPRFYRFWNLAMMVCELPVLIFMLVIFVLEHVGKMSWRIALLVVVFLVLTDLFAYARGRWRGEKVADFSADEVEAWRREVS